MFAVEGKQDMWCLTFSVSPLSMSLRTISQFHLCLLSPHCRLIAHLLHLIKKIDNLFWQKLLDLAFREEGGGVESRGERGVFVQISDKSEFLFLSLSEGNLKSDPDGRFGGEATDYEAPNLTYPKFEFLLVFRPLYYILFFMRQSSQPLDQPDHNGLCCPVVVYFENTPK